MHKLYYALTAILSALSTALVIGWVNDLDYWRRFHNINAEITRNQVCTKNEIPSAATETPASKKLESGSTYAEHRADKPSDKENAEGWLGWARSTRLHDGNWMPPVYTRLVEIKGVQSCAIEFTVLQIDNANARMITNQGDRIWLTGGLNGLIVNKAYSCKGLFTSAGTYEYKSPSEGTISLSAYHYLGERQIYSKRESKGKPAMAMPLSVAGKTHL